jgi:hypothetical protein
MYAELARYVAPKRKAIQFDGGDANRVVFNIEIAPWRELGHSPRESPLVFEG